MVVKFRNEQYFAEIIKGFALNNVTLCKRAKPSKG